MNCLVSLYHSQEQTQVSSTFRIWPLPRGLTAPAYVALPVVDTENYWPLPQYALFSLPLHSLLCCLASHGISFSTLSSWQMFTHPVRLAMPSLPQASPSHSPGPYSGLARLFFLALFCVCVNLLRADFQLCICSI